MTTNTPHDFLVEYMRMKSKLLVNHVSLQYMSWILTVDDIDDIRGWSTELVQVAAARILTEIRRDVETKGGNRTSERYFLVDHLMGNTYCPWCHLYYAGSYTRASHAGCRYCPYGCRHGVCSKRGSDWSAMMRDLKDSTRALGDTKTFRAWLAPFGSILRKIV